MTWSVGHLFRGLQIGDKQEKGGEKREVGRLTFKKILGFGRGLIFKRLAEPHSKGGG